ncbi:MAG: hypothetical protein L0Y76_10120, partial [Ignavibacteria bacterium]|nr:hypothetical protein [Ignavibacteria bacterium]
GTWDDPNTLFDDPENKRFFDVGFFENPLNGLDKYMLLVNKRCVPVQGGYGDERTVRLYINPSSLTGFNNWVLADVMTGDKIVFDKNNISGGVYFPFVFQPGEGKLLKLAPVMQEGGTFVCDESFSDINVNCKADVYTGGYNLIIGANASVEFNENCKITVENCGKLEMNGTSANPVRLKGKSSSKWYGIYANNISEYVLIEHAEFSNIKSGWALTIINCGLTAVSDSKFTLTDYEQSSSVSGIIVNNNSLPSASAYLINNELYFSNSNVAIAVLNNAETGGSGMIQYNTISNSVNGNTGLFLTNTYELVLSDNNLQNCKCGVKAINSSMTLTANTIFSNESGARGLEGTVWSTFQLGNDNFSQYGFNNISDLGNNSMNIKVDHSWFFAWYGENYFNVSE